MRAFPELKAGEEKALSLLNTVTMARRRLADALDSEEDRDVPADMQRVREERRTLEKRIQFLPVTDSDFAACYDYVADWVLDDQPVWLKTTTAPIVNIPYTQECNDVAMMLIQHHKASEYQDRALDQFEQIYEDAADSARVMALVIHPYIMGAPHRAEIFPPHLRDDPAEARRRLHDRRTDSRLVSQDGTESDLVPPI